MKMILSPKDNLGKMALEDVSAFAVEGPTLAEALAAISKLKEGDGTCTP